MPQSEGEIPVTNDYNAWMSPAEREKNMLRREARFVGVGMLLLMLFLRYAMSVVVWALQMGGMRFDANDKFLGLGNSGYLIFYMCIYALVMGLPMWISSIFIRGHKRPFSLK